MTLARARLTAVKETLSQAEISRQTGIPQSTLSYVLSGERELPDKYKKATRNIYQRTTYRQLRDTGLSATQARRWSWYSPPTVTKVWSEVGDVVDKLVNYRFEAYNDYLKRTGKWISDANTRERLRGAMEEALRKSDLPEERLAVMEYRNTNEL